MTSTFLLTTNLQRLSVSIPPHHTPGLAGAEVVPVASISNAPAFSFGTMRSRQDSIVSHSSSSSSVSALASPTMNISLALPKDAVPQSRDVKKLIKKTANLRTLEWLGRGACGIWRITRLGKEPKIDFLSITDLLDASSTNGALTMSPSQANFHDRRSSESSLFSASPLPLRRRYRTATGTSISSLCSLSSSSSLSSYLQTPDGRVEGLGLRLHNQTLHEDDDEDPPHTPTSPIAVLTPPIKLSERAQNAASKKVSKEERKSLKEEATLKALNFPPLASPVKQETATSPVKAKKTGRSASTSEPKPIEAAPPKPTSVKIVHGGG